SGQSDHVGTEVRVEHVWPNVVFPCASCVFLFRLRTKKSGQSCACGDGRPRPSGRAEFDELIAGGVMPAGVTTEVKTYKLFINGEAVASKSNKTIPVYDPSTEEIIALVPDANSDDVNRAVAAARAAFDEGPWATTTPQERGRVLFRLAEKIRQNSAALAELECRNTGKPIVEAEFDISDVATCFEYYGGLATKILGYV